jgi:hypothetical protein
MKLLNSFQRTLSYTPLAWLLLFTSYVVRAYIKLGRLPKYNNPDPKYLDFEVHHGFVLYFLIATYLFAFIWVPLTIVLYFINKKNVYKIDVVFYVVFYLIFINIGRIDPWGLITWFGD